jgi:hypothetical protein
MFFAPWIEATFQDEYIEKGKNLDVADTESAGKTTSQKQ